MSHRQVSVNGYESKEEWSTVQHVESYLDIANDIPHRSEGEGILLEYANAMQNEYLIWRWSLSEALKKRSAKYASSSIRYISDYA